MLSLLRKLSDDIEIVWINGNHDGPAEIVSHLLGVEWRDEMILESGGRRILLHHGHRFDKFLDDHPILTAIGDFTYRLLQRVDSSHRFARAAKRKSKTFLRCAAKIETIASDGRSFGPYPDDATLERHRASADRSVRRTAALDAGHVVATYVSWDTSVTAPGGAPSARLTSTLIAETYPAWPRPARHRGVANRPSRLLV